MDPRLVLVSAFLTGATAASPVALQQPGTYDVQGAYVAASQAADCHPDPRDIAGIQSVESPSAVVDSSGHVSNPDGSPVRGDGGQSYGAFQFYTVAGTWTAYGAGGDPDNLGDAAKATARMLCADNYATDRHAAIAAHNGSGPAAQAYADRVIAAADASVPINVPASSSAPSSSDDGCQPTGKRGLGDVLNRAWCGLVVKPWDKIRHNHPSPTLDKVDHAVFGDADATGGLAPASGQGARIVAAARTWVGRDFNPGVPAQCALFVRQALGDAGIHVGVTTVPVDGYAPTGEGRANSFGPDMGQVIHDPAQLQPGDVVMFANTYGDFAKGDITHVAIYAGSGQIIDRGTYDSPVTLRPLDTFAGHFAAGVRLGTPTGGAS